jgi:hypothetical protein
MTRQHRRVHVITWTVLGPLVVAALIAAMLARPTSPRAGAPASVEVSR